MGKRLMWLIALLGVVQAALAASPMGPANLQEYLQATKATRMLELLGVLKLDAAKLPGAAAGTLFVPSDAALEGLARDMGLTWAQLKARPQLVDLIVSYHLMPGYALKSKTDVPKNPTVGVSGDANFILVFTKEGNGFVVQDVQGNRVPVSQDPLRMSKLAIVPINKVLMSGAYFTSPAAALRHYPSWSTAAKLFSQAGAKAAAGAPAQGGGLTFFVPSDEAFAADARALTALPSAATLLSGDDASARAKAKLVAALPGPQAARVLAGHMAAPATPISADTRPGELASLAAGGPKLRLGVTTTETVNPWARSKVTRPVVTVSSGDGRAATIKPYNVYAGKDVLHGINKVLLLQGASGGSSAAAAPPKPPATAVGGRRRLAQQDSTQAAANFAAENAPSVPQTYSSLNTQNGFLSDNPAATFAAQNTASALRAGTDGQGRWDSYLWYQGYNNNGFQPPVNSKNPCYNCGYFSPQP